MGFLYLSRQFNITLFPVLKNKLSKSKEILNELSFDSQAEDLYKDKQQFYK